VSRTKNKSTGRREKLAERRRNLPLSKEKAPPDPSVAPTLQVKPEPREPSSGEKEILDLLWSEYEKSDEVARASARFESDIHEKLVNDRVAEGYSEDEAGEIQRVFRADDFNNIFRKLMQLRIERRLIERLDLDEYEEAIMEKRIDDLLVPKPKGTKSVTVQQPNIQVGDEETQQISALKARGRQRGNRWMSTK
jgi:hypothetical protein